MSGHCTSCVEEPPPQLREALETEGPGGGVHTHNPAGGGG